MKVPNLNGWGPVIVEGLKALPDLFKMFRRKPAKLDPPLGESEAQRVVREASEARVARKRP